MENSDDVGRIAMATWSVPFLGTVVTFTLTPTASGTRLALVQSGFQPDQKRESAARVTAGR